jgi:hypothetical protein
MRIVADEDPPPVGRDPVEDCGRGRRRGRRSLLAEAFNNRLVKYSVARSCWVQWPQPGSMIVALNTIVGDRVAE